MTAVQPIDLSPVEATALIERELAAARETMGQDGTVPDLDAILDAYHRALGLALQLGPAPAEKVLVHALATARELARHEDAAALSALGPTLVGLVDQVRQSGSLPPTRVMDAWATIASDLGALVGQVGLALALPPERRTGMLDNARTRASLLDDATHGLFEVTAWIDQLRPSP
ncbi:MAG: hypothetical protein PVG54_17340 [Anaerolineae bacterium]|jgi:hypothetical protein